MKPSHPILIILLWSSIITAQESTIDFDSDIRPILESACLSCHNEENAEGDLRLDSRKLALQGGDHGTSLVPGKPDESRLYALTILASDHEKIMPPADEPPLDKSQTDRLKRWIEQGAKWPADVPLKIQPRIDFAKHVQPIFEAECLGCHSSKEPEAGYDLSNRLAALQSGDNAPSIVPFRPDESATYTFTAVDQDANELMPPADSGGPLKKSDIEVLRLWVAQGAIWPEKLTLKQREKVQQQVETPDNIELVQKIHALIVDTSNTAANSFQDYSSKVPKTGAAFHMVAVNGGSFLMGSPTTEKHRTAAEGPQKEVSVDPFWIGRFEVTWDEYEPYMITQVDRYKHGARMDFDPNVHDMVDAVSQPTGPYTEMSFGMGQKGFPAISMTQHAANKYCQWLSAQTGHFYRLPTEAEWEYACRAGTTTAYSFGETASRIGQYAWYYDNSNEKYQKVGKKKPNPWGIHDMHGNVMEWTADRFDPDYFHQIPSVNPFLKPEKRYPRTVRGGGWDDDPEQLRSAFRRGSTKVWKQQDPQLPKSIWYHTNAKWLGFRIIRPKKIPTVEEMNFYWNSATNKL